MVQDGAVDLIHLADGENALLVRVLGRHRPGVLPWHDFLDAEIVVRSGFVQGRLDVCLSPDDVELWARALPALAVGHDVCWMDDGRNPEIRIEPDGRSGGAVIVVEDAAASGTSVQVPVLLADGWAEGQYERLRRVRAAWPREVVQTSSGACTWRR